MHLIGTYFQTLDAKGRVALPARLRRLLSREDFDSMVMTVGREECLLLYPLSEWNALTRRLKELPRGTSRRDAIRSISDHTTEVDLDANGRMTIPKEFLKRLDGDREAAFVGALDYIEVWPRKSYEQGLSKRRDAALDVLDEIF